MQFATRYSNFYSPHLIGHLQVENVNRFFQFIHVQTLRLRPSPQLKAEFSNPSASFHSTQSVAAVAMSKFDEKSPLPYEKLVERLAVVKSRLGRPLTLSEKVLYSHLDDPKGQGRCIP